MEDVNYYYFLQLYCLQTTEPPTLPGGTALRDRIREYWHLWRNRSPFSTPLGRYVTHSPCPSGRYVTHSPSSDAIRQQILLYFLMGEMTLCHPFSLAIIRSLSHSFSKVWNFMLRNQNGFQSICRVLCRPFASECEAVKPYVTHSPQFDALCQEIGPFFGVLSDPANAFTSYAVMSDCIKWVNLESYSRTSCALHNRHWRDPSSDWCVLFPGQDRKSVV